MAGEIGWPRRCGLAMPIEMLVDDERWAAVVRRDPAVDGAFYVAVKTTGIYCRPSCSGRPLRKNVRFVTTPTEAEAAGFRACKRCKPNEWKPGSLAQGSA
jgi:methylphosphotriester-DNA--protein-cysteine methyltransferase